MVRREAQQANKKPEKRFWKRELHIDLLRQYGVGELETGKRVLKSDLLGALGYGPLPWPKLTKHR